MHSEPVTQRINQSIRDRIKSGFYKPGLRLPSEVELASEFNVSRSTLRNAINSLVTEGIVIRKHGNGSYINEHIIQFNIQLQNLWSFPQLILESGRQPEVETLARFERNSTPEEEALLELPSPQPLFILQRLFKADGMPAIHSTNILPASLLNSEIIPADLDLSLYELVSRYCSTDLIYSVSELHAENAEPQIRERLNLTDCGTVLFFKDIFYTRDSHPVVIGQNYYNDQILSMRIVRSKA
jgi:GntR family transcriptional regulator